MTNKSMTKLIHEGKYVAEVDIELIVTDDEWAPYLSLEDAYKLDDVRQALYEGNLQEAAKFARIYELTPVVM